MNRIFPVLILFGSLNLTGQVEFNVGIGGNYNLGYFKNSGQSRERMIGKVVQLSAAYREGKDLYYRLTLQGAENIWISGYDSFLRERNLIRYRYLNVIPTVEYLPGRVIGFSGGFYFGILAGEHEQLASSGSWDEFEGFPKTRRLDPGVVGGMNLYLGSVSVSLFYTHGLISIKNFRDNSNPVSSFISGGQINAGLQLTVGYYFNIGTDEYE